MGVDSDRVAVVEKHAGPDKQVVGVTNAVAPGKPAVVVMNAAPGTLAVAVKNAVLAFYAYLRASVQLH